MRDGVMGRLWLALPAAAVLVGCGARNVELDAGADTGICTCNWDDKLSDFDSPEQAMIRQVGTPPRNGWWYPYNDGSDTCSQSPSPSAGVVAQYTDGYPPTPSPGPSGSFALNARWTGCTAWGAGIAADINVQLSSDGGANYATKLPYDVSRYTGLTFWAMATRGSDVQLRLKIPMRAETEVADGGACTDTANHRCSDDWGEHFSLPENGDWKQVTVRFQDAAFQQEGWGAEYPWDPTDVLAIRIQAVDHGDVSYDFWIDDMYFMP